MTAPDDHQESWHEELRRDPREALELAAASTCLGAQRLLEQAVAQRPDLSQAELAELLQVSAGRVSQVLHGEGVQNLALLARYLRALGYDVRLDAQPADDEVPALTRHSRARHLAATLPAATGHLYKQVFASKAGVYEATALVPSALDAEDVTPLGGPQLKATWRVSAAGQATFTAVPATADQPRQQEATHR